MFLSKHTADRRKGWATEWNGTTTKPRKRKQPSSSRKEIAFKRYHNSSHLPRPTSTTSQQQQQQKQQKPYTYNRSDRNLSAGSISPSPPPPTAWNHHRSRRRGEQGEGKCWKRSGPCLLCCMPKTHNAQDFMLYNSHERTANIATS